MSALIHSEDPGQDYRGQEPQDLASPQKHQIWKVRVQPLLKCMGQGDGAGFGPRLGAGKPVMPSDWFCLCSLWTTWEWEGSYFLPLTPWAESSLEEGPVSTHLPVSPGPVNEL